MKCNWCGKYILVDEFKLETAKLYPNQPDIATYSGLGICNCGKLTVSIQVLYPQKKD